MLRSVATRRIPPGGRVRAIEQIASAHFNRDERLKRYLSAYWLRPENAMWMTLRSEALSEVPMVGPSADFCCGDGIFSFIHAGGSLDPSFDVFCVTMGDVENATPCDLRSARRDMFDCISDAYAPKVLTRPDFLIDVGTDLKETLLEKAARLRFYERTMLHDCNQLLPFANESLQTIYCNSAYWVREVDQLLSEIARVLRPGGVAVLHVKLNTMRKCNLNGLRRVLGNKFLDVITCDRLDNWITLCDEAAWEQRFQHAGLVIKSQKPLATTTHARLWDVGLRPIAPMLIRLANSVAPITRSEVKRDWVSLMVDLALPMCDPLLSLDSRAGEPVEIQYVLARS
ncbi:MAG: methyltransferase domain-containing protein [Planctomycetes bacterium]|nr:methyltransferase domain-containing protein [Planctomycetota bacterium]MBI3836109.1 methyltransferase domain-containing protein [Planctomycetota bacterium]